MTYLDELLFGYFPYIALSVFLLGSLIRYDREQYTWKTGSSQMLSSKGMRWGSNLFHIGIILLFFGHLFGLLTPTSVYQALGITSAAKQMGAIVMGGLFGIMCLIGILILLHRRLTNARVRAAGSAADTFILVLIFVQLLLGMGTIPVSLGHPEGDVMVALSTWAQYIVTVQSGAAAYVSDVHWIYKAHIFLGLIMFLVFPFTRLVHVWSVPVAYLGRSYQLVRRR